MNLAYKYPIIYWNTANLIVDSGSNEEGKSTDYAKLASAVNKIRKEGITVSLVDINQSKTSFKPDTANNQILFGMKALSNINDSFIQTIEENRPYDSLIDFYNRAKPNRRQMISLIKAGAFDSLIPNRVEAMVQYLWISCDKKKRITLQNMAGLIKRNLLPEGEKYTQAKRIYEFNRYLKKKCGNGSLLTARALDFIAELDLEELLTSDTAIDMKAWDKFYKSEMDVFRDWMKEDQETILDNLNTQIFMEDWNKYASGNISSWEMEALCFYYHDHELLNVDMRRYGLSSFASLPEEPVVQKTFKKGDATIPIYKLYNIAGTCIAVDKNKATVQLLTVEGDVVPVKFNKEHFALFNSQISQRNADGSKKIIETSWFKRGNMIIVHGIRRGNEFVIKKYKSDGAVHRLYHIDKVNKDGTLILRSERYQGIQEEGDDDYE